MDLMLTLRMELHTVSEWLKANRLTLNAAKTKYMIFATRPKIVNFGNYPLSIDGHHLECVSNFKYLGIILDEVLSFSEHVDHLHSKVSSRLGLLKRS